MPDKNPRSRKNVKNITDHMLFIGLGLAVFYWLCEVFLNIFIFQKMDLMEMFFGTKIDEIWTRLVVLCLFVIFGSHAQYTIDNRKKMEQALTESEERYRTLIENIPIGICRIAHRKNGTVEMANPYLVRMLGFQNDEELNGRSIETLFLKPGTFDQVSKQLMLKGSLYRYELQFRTSNETPLWSALSARISESDGNLNNSAVYFDCIFEEIDEQKKAAEKMRMESETRRRFQKMLSPDLAELVVSGKLKVEKGGENRLATVLFADIRGFTTLSENTAASEVLEMLNDYFECMVEIVFRHEGTVDKFIGDAIMVNWGAPLHHDDDPVRAIRAAIEMRSMIRTFNNKRNTEGKQPIKIGIGINTGKLVAGYIGSSRTMSYSVIGDTVNTASRLCAAAKAGQILISETTYNCAHKRFCVNRLDPITVKGKMHPIQVFNVLNAAFKN